MRTLVRRSASFALFTILLAVSAASAQFTVSPEYVEGRVIVKFRPQAAATARARVLDALSVVQRSPLGMIGAEVIDMGGMSTAQAIALLADDPAIEYIEPDYLVYAVRPQQSASDTTRIPNDPRFRELWGMHNTGQTGGTPGADIDAPQAWMITTGGDVIVGVIDSGVDYRHPDLADNMWRNPGEIPGNGIDDDRNGFVDDVYGWDFFSNDNDPMDGDGHGTHVAGTIAARGDNNVGVAGVNWQARIMALRFLGPTGGTTSNAIRAIDYARTMGAHLTNNSWGGGGFSTALRDAIAATGEAGMLFLAAAGNDGQDTDRLPHYPSGYDLDNIISVAATDHNDRLASFSNFGLTTVDLAAPGVSILSTTPSNSYSLFSGTSMATPHVAGAAALVLALYPGTPPDLLKNALMSTVEPKETLEGRMVTGGRLNVHRALLAVEIDSIAPAPVSDLQVLESGSNDVILAWTASGDDGNEGQATSYDIRYALAPITEDNFDVAPATPNPPFPQPAGETERFIVTGLDFNTTYYFALRVLDERRNSSTISNLVSATTLGVPTLVFSPDSLVERLFTGDSATQNLTIRNDGEGSLDVELQVFRRTTPQGASAASPVMPAAYRPPPPDRDADEIFAAGLDLQPTANPFPLPYRDGFEDGNFDDWLQGPGAGIKRVTDLTAAVGRYSFFYNNTTSGHRHGIHQQFVRDQQPGYISFHVRPGSRTLSDAYVVFTGNNGLDEVIFFFARSDGFFYLNADVGGNNSVRYNAEQWYHIEFREIDWQRNQLDYYVDGLLIQAGVPFRNPLSVRNIDYLYLYNFHQDGRVWWDHFDIGGTPADWLHINTTRARIRAGEAFDVVATFNATGLFGGLYTGEVQISSNDPVRQEAAVPARLYVTGIPRIAVSTDSLLFDQIFPGQTQELSFDVSNPGTENLIISSATAEPEQFSISPQQAEIAPLGSQTFRVVFAPQAAIAYDGWVTIVSNAGNAETVRVALVGSGVEPPEVEVSPPALSASLFTGDSLVQEIVIYNRNPNGKDLLFSIATEEVLPESRGVGRRSSLQAAGLAGAPPIMAAGEIPDQRSVRRSGNTALTTRIPFREGFETRSLSDWIDDGGGGIREITDQAAASGRYSFYYNNSTRSGHYHGIHREFVDGTQPSYVSFWVRPGATNRADSYFVLTTDSTQVRSVIFFFASSNGRFSVNIGSGGDGEFIYQAQRWYHVEFKNIDWERKTFDYYVDGVLLKAAIPLANQNLVNGIDGLYLYNFTLNGQAWWDEIFIGHDGVFWLRPHQTTGVVPGGDSVRVPITFNAAGLDGGTYEANIFISSNDPVDSVLVVPATLRVTGAPNIAVTPDSVDFGEVYIGIPDSLTVTVANTGTDLLEVSSIEIVPGAFSTEAAPFSLEPGTEAPLRLRFFSAAVGEFTSALTLRSNDPVDSVLTVPLRAQAVRPPVLTWDPTTFDWQVEIGEDTSSTLLLGNTGGSTLTFQLRDEEGGPFPASIEQRLFFARTTLGPAADTLFSARPDGSRPERLFWQAGDVLGMEFDPGQRRLYWTDGSTNDIRSSNLDGSGIQVLVSNLLTPVDLALDLTNGKMYWTEFLGNRISRANLDGSGVEIISQGTPSAAGGQPGPRDPAPATPVAMETGEAIRSPWGIALDVANGKVYWTEQLGNRVMRINFDGSGREIVMDTDISGARGIQIDSQNGKLYLVNSFALQILRANLDGSGREILVNTAPGVSNPLDLELDVEAGYFYWTDNISNQVLRASLAGTEIEVVVDRDFFGTRSPFGLGQSGGSNWLTQSPLAGSIAAGGGQEVRVTASARNLLGGVYRGTIFIDSNDPTRIGQPAEVPVTLTVSGVPAIAVSDSTLDFGEVFLQQTSTLRLRITNNGTGVLLIDEISSNEAAFFTDSTRLTVLPRETMPLDVHFRPIDAINYNGLLRLQSNDPNAPLFFVSLNGRGAIPPVIAVSPDSLSDSLRSGRQSVLEATIRNTGDGTALQWRAFPVYGEGASTLASSPIFAAGSPLPSTKTPAGLPKRPSRDNIYAFPLPADRPAHVAAGAQQPLESVLESLNDRHPELRQAIPNHFLFEEGETGTHIVDGGRDMYDDGNFLYTSVGGPIEYSNNTIIPSRFFGVNGRYLTRKYPALFMVAADLDGIDFFEINGNLGADGSGRVDGSILEIHHNGTHYRGFVKRVSGTSDPSVNHLIVVAGNPAANHEFSTNTDDDYHRVFNLNESTRIYYLLYAGIEGGYIDDAATLNLMNIFLDIIDPTPTWLHVVPDSGVVVAGDAQPVEVRLDAEGLDGGDYAAALIFASNDPLTPQVRVPVSLHVIGAPNLSVTPARVDFGEVFLSTSQEAIVVVSNTGSELLEISELDVEPAVFSTDATPFTLVPGARRSLVLRFAPVQAGNFSGRLRLVSNDPDDPVIEVELSGSGVVPPEIFATPSSFAFSMQPDSRREALLLLRNRGGSTLNYVISDQEFPAPLAGDQRLLWSVKRQVEADSIFTSDLDGSRLDLLHSGPLGVNGMAVDPVQRTLYWADDSDGSIRIIGLDGSSPRVVVSGQQAPVEVAVDYLSKKIYWTDFAAGTINRANLDGSEQEVIVGVDTPSRVASPHAITAAVAADDPPELQPGIVQNPWGIALDLVRGKVYWTDQEADQVGRANLDGSAAEIILDAGDNLNGPRGIEIDMQAGKIYFVDSFNDAVKRADLDGGNVETLRAFLATDNVLSLALHPASRHIFVTDNIRDYVLRLDSDGSNPQVLYQTVAEGTNGPLGIAVFEGSGWLSQSPSAGSIAAGDVDSVRVMANSNGLVPGQYRANLLIDSNDPAPDRRQLQLPVELRVAEAEVIVSIPADLQAVAGDTVAVPLFVAFDSTRALAAFGAAIKVQTLAPDAGLLQFAGLIQGSIVPGELAYNAPAPDSVRLAFTDFSSGPIASPGLLATLYFSVAPGAGDGAAAILRFSDLSAADTDLQTMTVLGEPGRVTVIGSVVIAGSATYSAPANTDVAVPVADLQALLSSGGNPVATTQTNAAGQFRFADVPPGPDYALRLQREHGGTSNAVTPVDALLAFRAYLGRVTLSGSQMLAADVNGDNAVTPGDAERIFNRFLGTIDRFPVDDWRTFPASFDIDAEPEAWKAAPAGFEYARLNGDRLGQNVLAVVRGDVDLNWPIAGSDAATPVLAKTTAPSGPALDLLVQAGELDPYTKTATVRVLLDGEALANGLLAIGGTLSFDASMLEIAAVRWGDVVPATAFRAGHHPQATTYDETSGKASGGIRFGGFATATTTINTPGVLLEIDVLLIDGILPEAGVAIEVGQVSAATGRLAPLADGLARRSGAAADVVAAPVRVTAGELLPAALPAAFALQANYPNPFNPATTIRYQLPQPAQVRVQVFNALGQVIRVLLDETRPAGFHQVLWDGRDEAGIAVASGVYFYRIEAIGTEQRFAQTRKMLMLK